MDDWNEFHGPNAAYVLELYERYRQDPESVDESARAYFASHSGSQTSEPLRPEPVDSAAIENAAAAVRLAQAIRWYGHWAAQLDPLSSAPPGDPSLALATYGLSEAALARLPGSLIQSETQQPDGSWLEKTALDGIRHLRETYSSTLGHDYLQIRVPEHRAWLREAAETRRFGVEANPLDPLGLLDRLTQVEVFEHFLQRAFPGKTRFSIEGLDMLVPLLDEIIAHAAGAGIDNILIGMAHRGRLNVLAHVLQKPYRQILAEFKDPLRENAAQTNPDSGMAQPTRWAGDVKYHAGAHYLFDADHDPETAPITIHLAPNPSHLEAVNPVVMGMARAAGTGGKEANGNFDPSVTLPILIHGDASFPGQGVVAETLNMHRLPGYTTGGTIHIIANNQLGFTTNPSDSRSTLFASDVAKGYRIPILHVNADDPEAVITAARIAFAWRAKFHRDFLIDLIGYRRLGHNEGDEPGYTQPTMYESIQKHPTVRQIWVEKLITAGKTTAQAAEECYQEKMVALQQELETLIPEESLHEPIPDQPPPGAARSAQTRASKTTLQRLMGDLLQLPEGFQIHSRLARFRQRREAVLAAIQVEGVNGSSPQQHIDWAAAEELAFASILYDGVPVRLTGQDVERGTFSTRHAVLFDPQSGARHVPLQSLPGAKAAFEIYNSPLSEYAALGFEFGYNVQSPYWLVVWEAQYGDFINNAQTIIDEFIASARDKWGQLPSIVLLLPHGHEGQGPDHSSARLERFLNLSSEDNLRVAYPTTAANYFHLLRRQAALLEVDPLPLIVMTPKSLLRNPLVASPWTDFYDGAWQPVYLPKPRTDHANPLAAVSPQDSKYLVLCSGKLAVDLATAEPDPTITIARLEQISPFPGREIEELLQSLPRLDHVVWAQEEPENMGAWQYLRPHLERALAGRAALTCIARGRSATPAEGSSAAHAHHQQQLIDQILHFAENRRPGER